MNTCLFAAPGVSTGAAIGIGVGGAAGGAAVGAVATFAVFKFIVNKPYVSNRSQIASIVVYNVWLRIVLLIN